MSASPNETCYVFLIKTDSYAGNFERPMCSYATGQYGDCGVGDKEAVMFEKECPGNFDFEDLILMVTDEHGCYRPASIWEYDNNCETVAIFFNDRPTDGQLLLIRQRAMKFASVTDPCDGKHNTITIMGFELVKYSVTVEQSVELKWVADE